MSILRIGWQLVELYLFIVGTSLGQAKTGVAFVQVAFIAYQALILCLINMESVRNWSKAKEQWKKTHP